MCTAPWGNSTAVPCATRPDLACDEHAARSPHDVNHFLAVRVRMRRRDFFAWRDANHARRAVVRLDGVVRHEPAHLPAGQPELVGVVFVNGRYGHREPRAFHRSASRAVAICDGVRPNASISSSYVPEWMNCGRPSRSSVLIARTGDAVCPRAAAMPTLSADSAECSRCSARPGRRACPTRTISSSSSSSIDGMSTTADAAGPRAAHIARGRERLVHTAAAAHDERRRPPAIPRTNAPLPNSN